MTTKFFKRAAMVSWTMVLLGAVGVSMLPASTAEAAFLVAFFSLPVALYSPVGLACAFVVASGRGWTRLARLGIFLTYVSAPMTYSPTLSLGVFGQSLVRLLPPLYLIALAVVYASLVSIARVGPRLERLGLASVIAMSMVPIVVLAMVIVDSGNRTLFAGLGALIVFAVASGLVLLVAHRRRRHAMAATASDAA